TFRVCSASAPGSRPVRNRSPAPRQHTTQDGSFPVRYRAVSVVERSYTKPETPSKGLRCSQTGSATYSGSRLLDDFGGQLQNRLGDGQSKHLAPLQARSPVARHDGRSLPEPGSPVTGYALPRQPN